MRVVLAEDLFLLRDGLSNMLSRHGAEIVAAVDSGPALVEALRQHRPDLAVVDVRLPPTYTDEGLRITLEARRESPALPVLILSQHVEQLYARELLADNAGAVGYLLKERVLDADQFMDAARRVAAGGTVMDPDVINKLMVRTAAGNGPMTELTDRELEILELMAAGLSNKAIGARLFVSEGAISKHTTNIFSKLKLTPSDDNNRRVLAVLAYLDRTSDLR